MPSQSDQVVLIIIGTQKREVCVDRCVCVCMYVRFVRWRILIMCVNLHVYVGPAARERKGTK
jgi:hypothetical protein